MESEPDFAKVIRNYQKTTRENMERVKKMINQAFMTMDEEKKSLTMERDHLTDELSKLIISHNHRGTEPWGMDMSLDDIMIARGLTREEIDEIDEIDISEQPEWWSRMSDHQKKLYLDTELDMYFKFHGHDQEVLVADERDEEVLI